VSKTKQFHILQPLSLLSMREHQRENLSVVNLPLGRRALYAPPVLIASTHTVDYCCGRCGIVLLHAEVGQVHNLLIYCIECRSYNSTDS
jgi:hypothetical protein